MLFTMASQMSVGVFLILALMPFMGSGETCRDPKVTPEIYTTSEAAASTDTVMVVEFSLQCAHGVKDANLYAEMRGKTYPVAKVGTGKYQVSFSDEHKKFPSGVYNVRFFDEESYADLRKLQRSGEDISSMKSLFTIPVDHKGASSGPVFQSEFIVASVAILVWYKAYTTRAKLQQ